MKYRSLKLTWWKLQANCAPLSSLVFDVRNAWDRLLHCIVLVSEQGRLFFLLLLFFSSISRCGSSGIGINPLNPELNPICYLLALLGAHHFLHVSRIRVKLHVAECLRSSARKWSRGHYSHVTWVHIKLTFYFQVLPYPFPCVGSHVLVFIIWWLGVM